MSVSQSEILEFAKTCKVTDNVLRSPIIWGLSLMGKQKTPRYSSWQVFITLADESKQQLPFKLSYVKGPIPEGSLGVYWTVNGKEDGKLTKTPPTYIATGKNIGKANATNPFTQALATARSLFNNKLRKGGSINKADLQTGPVNIADLIKRGEWRVFAMALQDVSKKTPSGTSFWKHLTYPGIIQPKYDGTRFLVVQHPDLPERKILLDGSDGIFLRIDGFSRGRENYDGQDHILNMLYPILIKYPGIYIDGELWKEGYGLQQISGSSRRQSDSKSKGESLKLDYYIFDCFDISKPLTPFSDRLTLIEKIYTDIKAFYPDHPNLKLAPHFTYNSKEEAVQRYTTFLDEGYEGGVLRNMDSPYEFGTVKEKRSYQTMKIKPMDDDEWPLIGFTQGIRGKDVGAIIWILEATPTTVATHNEKYNLTAKLLPTPEENRFDAVPKGMTYEQRYAAFKYLTDNPQFFTTLKNKLMRVQFSIISDYGKPQQPKVLGFKDLDLNALFMEKITPT